MGFVSIPLKAGHRFRLRVNKVEKMNETVSLNPLKSGAPIQTTDIEGCTIKSVIGLNPLKSGAPIQTTTALLRRIQKAIRVSIPLKAGHRFRQ